MRSDQEGGSGDHEAESLDGLEIEGLPCPLLTKAATGRPCHTHMNPASRCSRRSSRIQ